MIAHPNRRQRMHPKSGKTWCWRCDATRVGDGEKCRYCGKRHRKGVRFKKESS